MDSTYLCLLTFLISSISPTIGQLFSPEMLNMFDSNLNLIPPNERGRVKDTSRFEKEYDFVVIGAGSGGSVMANRLSEIADWSVLLLEAGDEEISLTDIPLLAALTQLTSYNWGYKTSPVPGACLGLEGGVCNWPRGRALGGSSVINFMIYTRGNKKDYDHWEELGNQGWSYKDVLPYFLKSENVEIPDLKNSPFHSTEGYLTVDDVPYKSPLTKEFLNAGIEMGYNISDLNGENQIGFSLTQANIRNGRRCSASKAFLRPIRFRKNLHVSKNSRVTKILIDPNTKQIFGVEFIKNKVKYIVKAKKEVILSAGTIGSAHLLLLSGVGPKEHLNKFGIPVIQDLKVGYNLQDHISLSGLAFRVNASITVVESRMQSNPVPLLDYILHGRGPYTIPGGAEALAFIKTKYNQRGEDYPDIEVVLGAGALSGDSSGTLRKLLGITDEFYKKVYGSIIDTDAFAMAPILLNPKSRGRISLKSRNPFHWPIMEPNYFQDEQDLKTLREGAKLTVQIARTSGFKKYNTTLHNVPFLGCEHLIFESDEYWECCIRQVGGTLHHQVGTCKMGPSTDKDAVVDPELLVYGIQGLRVVDASIMPVIPASHTNAPIYMIGEKAADMVKQKWKGTV